MNLRIRQVTWKIVERGSKARMPSVFVELTQEDSGIPAVALQRDLARVLLLVARALRERCGA